MKKIKFKTHQKKWERMSKLWNEFTKPGRPSRDDIKNYEKLLEIALGDKKFFRIIVLGATPEIRNLLNKYSKIKKAEIICVDMTKDMYMAMNEFIRDKNPKERFVSLNWIELSKKIKPHSIDVVMGDYVIGNVGGSEENFLTEISKILKPDGGFITRTQIMNGISNKFDLLKEFKRTCSQVRKKQITIKEASSYYANNLILYTWHLNKKNKISLSYIDDKNFLALDDAIKIKKDPIEKKLLSQLYHSWFLMKDKYWTNHRKADLEKILKKRFKIKKTFYSKDYNIAKQSPIYLLIKK